MCVEVSSLKHVWYFAKRYRKGASQHSAGRRGSAALGGGGGRGASASSDPYGKERTEKTNNAVSHDAQHAKKCLRSHAGPRHRFFLERTPNKEAYSNRKDVTKTRTGENCEAMNRLGYALSFFSANSEARIDT